MQLAVGDREYRFPEDEVRLLPLANVTMELLARYVWEQMAQALRGSGAEDLTVEVEETAGQSCAYAAPLPTG